MAGALLSSDVMLMIGGKSVDKQDSQLLEAVRKHLVSVALNEEVGNPRSQDEPINVVVIEGDQREGIGVVMSEPLIIQPRRAVFCGDLVKWQPGSGGMGRITRVITPDFETMDGF